MLAVGIHDQTVGKPVCEGGAGAGEHGAALAFVGRQPEHRQPWFRPGQGLERHVAGVRAPVDDHPNRPSLAQRLRHDRGQPGSGVVGRHEDKRGKGSHRSVRA
jgi:hypothetical protein